MGENKKNTIKCNLASVIHVIHILKGKWIFNIWIEISNGNNHFGTLLRSLPGLNPRSLAHSLKTLEKENIIIKETNSLSQQSTYNLTEKGKSLKCIFTDMNIWADKYA
ncbi:helix-turn-helix transcriptional regulator [Bombilactobacillus folatiphilus]|uniref:Helix-turn-helix transcriptional regulator n=1 Tax=Bombilactobacillus folatiphilus TaxID=2923362 RepID=A0ABY4P9F4_9LACO|nr:helix-turn-helix domain-containing protein [Bombilactobacillus folatiphilus]UQS82229.1 helix-turn-helix transcriptional regulator [Bombilactobacillus folatiphilus]